MGKRYSQKERANNEYVTIHGRTANQKRFLTQLFNDYCSVAICAGKPGTGKTLLSLYYGLQLLRHHSIDKIYYVRNEPEVGEIYGCKQRGALPGTIDEKYSHMLYPVRDNLKKLILSEGKREFLINKKQIEAISFEDLRGRTLDDCLVVIDEAQNATPHAIKTCLTRMGSNCKVIILGDPNQKDTKNKFENGLRDAIRRLRYLDFISVIAMQKGDIQRNPHISQILDAYDEGDTYLD